MSESASPPEGPDLASGIELAEVAPGACVLGHVGDQAVLLVRPGPAEEIFAIAPACTHYGGPLADGLLDGDCIRCPWHHARFDVRTGDAIAAPALERLASWIVERRGSRVFVGAARPPAPSPRPAQSPANVVIVGAGAAGNAAAEMLRREGYAGPITIIGAEDTRPTDRPNLSKDFLAGTAPEEWVFLRGDDFYAAHDIELVTGVRVEAIDPAARTVRLSNGASRSYGALLLATGAEPIRLPIPGADLPHVFTLRSLGDSRRIIARATADGTRDAVVIGASFIGLEAAASLRKRGLEVTVVGPETRPLERVLGPELGDFVRGLHEQHGVRFRLGRKPQSIDAASVTLDDGSRLPADVVVMGVGVRPAVALAEGAGLRTDRGVLVDALLATSVPGIFAAGDIARYPDPGTGAGVRIEHWVVAERQGQTAARNMLGRGERFTEVPFFWSQHYDVAINYVGHAESWDRIDVSGSIADGDALVAYRQDGEIRAIVTLNRDLDGLRAESYLERNDRAGLESLLNGRRRP
jgi:apoptosis-inducing factor 3